MASIIIFGNDEKIFYKIIADLKSNISGWEIWKIKKNIIVKNTYKLLNDIGYDKINMDLTGLPIQYKQIIEEITTTLNWAIYFSKVYNNHYNHFIEYVQKSVEEMCCYLRYISLKISIEKLTESLKNIFPYDEESDISDRIASFEKSINNPINRRITINQITDELIQISAIIKSFNSQAFCGSPPILEHSYRSGIYSLLGIGNALFSIAAIYKFLWNAFNQYDIANTLDIEFKNMRCPQFMDNPADYDKWYRYILTNNFFGLDVAKKFSSNSAKKMHILYFSNRLGFRETKHSISAAYQVIPFGLIANWSIFTFTHEYIHSINRIICSLIYPIQQINNDVLFDDLYRFYTKRLGEKENAIPNLNYFLKIIIMHVVTELHSLTIGTSTKSDSSRYRFDKIFSKPDLIEALERCHHHIDEIMVHILDFNYFYQSKTSVYIKAIWSSWFSLPVTISRIPEYLLRTICAICSNIAGDRINRFNIGIDQLKSAIESIKISSPQDTDQVDEVLNFLLKKESVEKLKAQFFALCPLIDTTTKFLICSSIQGILRKDSQVAQQADDSYSYDLDPGTFEIRRIDNPILFIFSIIQSLMFAGERINSDDIEFNTLWMLIVVGSSACKDQG